MSVKSAGSGFTGPRQPFLCAYIYVSLSLQFGSLAGALCSECLQHPTLGRAPRFDLQIMDYQVVRFELAVVVLPGCAGG